MREISRTIETTDKFVDPVENRIEHLVGLDVEGFEKAPDPGGRYRETVEMLSSIGLPVDDIQVLAYEQNTKGRHDGHGHDHGHEHDTSNLLGTWEEHKQRYTLYELAHRQIPEQRFATATHELFHTNSPMKARNIERFGGEEEFLAAQHDAVQFALQSFVTGKYLDGYQASICRDYGDVLEEKAEMDENPHATKEQREEMERKMAMAHHRLVEESFAIAGQYAITNRKHLEEVQAAQHEKLDRMANSLQPNEREIGKNFARTQIASKVSADGREVTLGSIDRAFLNLSPDVSNYDELVAHTEELKKQFYPEESTNTAEIARQRAARKAAKREQKAANRRRQETLALA